ncbi:MAG: NAD(P)-dependent oxidoreductase [Gammaproteobacteria bacterium]|nr:NAD(P)-dependent oxidoreductase [Gammaproteobacteria bacterium]
MTVLIAGGTGFIGLNLAERLLRDGHTVVLMDRSPPRPAAAAAFDRLPGRWHFVQTDVTSAVEVRQVFASHPIDRVFYGAAVTSGAQREREHPEQVMAVNVLGLAHVLKSAASTGVSRLINISSGSAYGNGGLASFGASGPLDEDRTRPLPSSLYSVSKFASEGVCRRYAALSGMDAFSVRLSTIFGPWELDSGRRDTLSGPMQAAQLALRGETAIVPRLDSKDWTYSRDVADALVALMNVREHRFDLYNISAERTCSLLDLMQVLAGHFPGFSARLAEPGEASNIVLHGDEDRLPMSSRRLRIDIGYSLGSDIEPSVNDYVEWIKAHQDYWI